MVCMFLSPPSFHLHFPFLTPRPLPVSPLPSHSPFLRPCPQSVNAAFTPSLSQVTKIHATKMDSHFVVEPRQHSDAPHNVSTAHFPILNVWNMGLCGVGGRAPWWHVAYNQPASKTYRGLKKESITVIEAASGCWMYLFVSLIASSQPATHRSCHLMRYYHKVHWSFAYLLSTWNCNLFILVFTTCKRAKTSAIAWKFQVTVCRNRVDTSSLVIFYPP